VTTKASSTGRSACPACESHGVSDVAQVPDHEYGLDYLASYACCGECGTLYQSPMPSEAELASFYRQNYHSMSDGGFLMSLRHKLRIRRLAECVKGGGAVLDYGCGNGSFICRAGAELTDIEFIGYEIGDRRKVTRSADRVTIVEGTPADLFEMLPPCQAVIMNHVIEHLPDPFAVVSALAEKLLPGGYFDGQTPNATSLEHRIFGRRWSGFHAPRHTAIFSIGGLRSLLERAKFEAISIHGAFNPAGYAVSLASLSHGQAKGVIPRHGLKWLFYVAAAAAVLPIDVWSGAPGIIDFRARKKGAA
jgi:SAM-dependent methyltransferase